MEFLIPFQGRRPSAQDQCNFLWRKDNIYVMDNHLLALWCWFQHLSSDPCHLLHIDAHDDCDPALSKIDLDVRSLGLKSYLESGLFRWDNYLPVLLERYSSLVGHSVAATHNLGIPGPFKQRLESYDLLKHLDDLLLMRKPWIVNIDFDYFYARSFKSAPLYSDIYIREIFKLVKLNYDMGHIRVLTACLSPECCGGWPQAEHVLEIFCQEMDVKVDFTASCT